MTATGAPALAHHNPASDVLFDLDESFQQDLPNSPLMKPQVPNLGPSPSTPPAAPPKIRPSQGDAVLIHYLDGGRNQDLPLAAMMQPLQDCDDQSKSGTEDTTTDESGDEEDIRSNNMSPDPIPRPNDPKKPIDLQSLATNALAAVTAATHPADPEAPQPHDGDPRIALKTKPPDPPKANGTEKEIGMNDTAKPVLAAPVSPYPPSGPHEMYSPRTRAPSQVLMHPRDVSSPTALPSAGHGQGHGELPPIQIGSPRSDSSNHESLPSIRDHLQDQLSPPKHEIAMRHGNPFPNSPPSGVPRMGAIPGSHASPPISPNEAFRQGMPSPARTLMSPYYYSSASSTSHRRSVGEYNSNGETPNTDHSTPATQGSITDRMSIDNMTNPQVGAFICTFQGCTAPPFQTQYLLNSHANVHSSARPHYCPVKGCPRSEGGKGFKRKNEMIRHGLVHDSPGYVCPFCPDREHKYPRPDNLQRHVRVHHVDKDKDDPALRDVLAQRPDGPNRGRRRRGGP